jgi:hypothetical protein
MRMLLLFGVHPLPLEPERVPNDALHHAGEATGHAEACVGTAFSCRISISTGFSTVPFRASAPST